MIFVKKWQLVTAAGREGWACVLLLFPESDAAAGEVVGGHFDCDFVALKDADVVLAHFATDSGEHNRAIFQLHAE